MDYHQNARLTVHGRERMPRKMEEGVTLKLAAARFNLTARTAGKWVRKSALNSGARSSADCALTGCTQSVILLCAYDGLGNAHCTASELKFDHASTRY